MVRYCALWVYVGVVCAAPVLNGPSKIGGETFPFAVQAHAFDQGKRRFFVGAQQDISEHKTFSLSVSEEGESDFFPIAPEKAEVNNVADQPNPLFGKGVRFLRLFNGNPFVVLESDPTKLHYVFTFLPISRTALVSTDTLVDAKQDPIGEILGVDASFPHFIAAVRPESGVFGDPGSGLAVGEFQQMRIGEGESDVSFNFQLRQTHVFPLDITTPAIRITSDALQFNNTAQQPVSIHADEAIHATYTGISVTSNVGANDGVRSVVVGNASSIAPDAAIQADSIVGARGSQVTVSAHRVRTLFTSTLLSYLVVVGGVGDPADTKRQVFALPLVTDRKSGNFGKLARRDAQPVDVFSDQQPKMLTARVISDAAAVAGDLFGPTDSSVRVGGGLDLPGDITDIFAERDAIFVSVAADDGATEHGGIFYSQAIFDSLGRVAGWTDWRRAGGEVGNIFGFSQTLAFGNFWLLTGKELSEVNTVKRTRWSPAESSIDLTFSHEAVPAENGGIQQFVDIDRYNSFVDQTVGSRLSFVLETGFGTVSLVQSGTDRDGVFTPLSQVSIASCTNGQLCNNPTDGYTVTGGALTDLGPIVAADFVSDGVNSWLVVGGIGGVAVLMKDDGTGWNGPLQKDFAPLGDSFRFMKVSTIPYVRKIIADEGIVYILTDQQLLRFLPSATDFAAETIDSTLLAQAGDLPDGDHAFLLDCVISDKLAFIGTSSGLLRSNDGVNIRTATAESVGWRSINLPEGVGPVTTCHVISPTGRDNDITRDERGGMIYLLNAYVGLDQTRVYRLSVRPTAAGPVTAETVSLLPDQFIQRTKSFFLNRGDYRNNVATDGAIMLLTRSRYQPQNRSPFVEVLPGLRLAKPFAARKALVVTQSSEALQVCKPIRRSATGAWIIPYNTGIQTNQ